MLYVDTYLGLDQNTKLLEYITQITIIGGRSVIGL